MIERNGPLSYRVQESDNRVWKRHIDHIRTMTDSPQQEETQPQVNSGDHDIIDVLYQLKV